MSRIGQGKKQKYDRYTLAYKLQAFKLVNNHDGNSKDAAASPGIHPVMLYRWQMEYGRVGLVENKRMKPTKHSPKRRPTWTYPLKDKEEELAKANKRVRDLETPWPCGPSSLIS